MRRSSFASAVVVVALGWIPSVAPSTYGTRVMSGSVADVPLSPPSEFVVVRDVNSSSNTLDLVSTASGRVIRTLLTFSELSHPSLTNNGLQLSANGEGVGNVRQRQL